MKLPKSVIGSLEEATKKHLEHCEACDSKLSVHAYRRKMSNKKEAIYASCLNKACRKFERELCFYNI